jgi:hypothetical protein
LESGAAPLGYSAFLANIRLWEKIPRVTANWRVRLSTIYHPTKLARFVKKFGNILETKQPNLTGWDKEVKCTVKHSL